MEGYDASSYGDGLAEVYDDWFADHDDGDEAVTCLAALAREAAMSHRAPSRRPVVLELGVGTGRLAIPLAELDLDVRGIDASAAMLEQLRAKPGAAALVVDRCDMAAPAMPRRDDDPGPVEADLVFVAYNTLFNLPDEDMQRACLEGVAALLAPAGRMVVEAFVPDLIGDRDNRVSVRTLEAERLVLVASILDAERQIISGQYVDITEQGITLRPWHIAYRTPAQLDVMATDAGLALQHRWGGYDRTTFDLETSTRHVSVYQRMDGRMQQ